MDCIALLGTGLMGSSLGLALKKRSVPVRIQAYARRAETRALALERGVADAVFDDPADAVRGAGMVVLCVPVLAIPGLAEACRAGLAAGTLVTDVGSTKGSLNARMAEVLAGTGAEFIGSHPICGSEQQGVEAGNADLYEGAVTVVTPADRSASASVERVATLWRQAGSVVKRMTAEEHDRILARTSHLPHIAAAAAALSGGDNGLLCGSGFRDTTRVAAGSPVVWRDIISTNREQIKIALDDCLNELNELRRLLEEGDSSKIETWLERAAANRKKLLDQSGKGADGFNDLTV